MVVSVAVSHIKLLVHAARILRYYYVGLVCSRGIGYVKTVIYIAVAGDTVYAVGQPVRIVASDRNIYLACGGACRIAQVVFGIDMGQVDAGFVVVVGGLDVAGGCIAIDGRLIPFDVILVVGHAPRRHLYGCYLFVVRNRTGHRVARAGEVCNLDIADYRRLFVYIHGCEYPFLGRSAVATPAGDICAVGNCAVFYVKEEAVLLII